MTTWKPRINANNDSAILNLKLTTITVINHRLWVRARHRMWKIWSLPWRDLSKTKHNYFWENCGWFSHFRMH